MRKALLLIASLCLFYITKAADTDSLPRKQVPHTYRAFYGELGGSGVFYSLNYDQRFVGQHGFGARIGASVFPELDPHGGYLLFLPFEINYLVGEDRINFIELGIGATLANALDYNYFNALTTRQLGVAGHYTVGYRYQSPRARGINFRIFVSPFFVDGRTQLWGGISFGRRL